MKNLTQHIKELQILVNDSEINNLIEEKMMDMWRDARNDTIDMVLVMFPFKHPATEKRELKQGFYQGCKFVNETAVWRLHNLKLE